jgi:hypothetical protein
MHSTVESLGCIDPKVEGPGFSRGNEGAPAKPCEPTSI